MLTDAALTMWLAERYGWRVLGPRIRDVGYAFHVAAGPDDAPADGGVLIVVRRTGAGWQLPVHPALQPVHTAGSEGDFYGRLGRVLPDRNQAVPDAVVPLAPALTTAALADWLARRYGWTVFDGRIADLGFAYSVSTHPDAYHAGDQSAMTYGNGPLTVLKRTGAVWGFGSNPIFLPVFEARDEQSFHAAVAAAMPTRDLAQPDDTVPVC